MYIGLSIFLAAVVLYTVFASRLSRLSITMPMVFVIIGLLLSLSRFAHPHFDFEASDVEHLSEITLALLLFADASTLDFRKVSDDAGLIARLLLIGLPLTIAFGGMLAFGFYPGGGIGSALLLGSILAPTDLALGLPIFNNPRVPARIRRALNVESGLNDGVATPFVAIFLALALVENTLSTRSWVLDALLEIAIAVVVAIVVGILGGKLFALAVTRAWTGKTFLQVGNLALAAGAYFGSLALGGNGFIAAFGAGLLFGFITRDHLREASEFTETFGTLLALFVWAVFGANFIAPLLTSFNPLALLYALLSLTLIRMLPVAISLTGMGFRPDTRLMMGWLGPRGLASVVFLMLAFEAFHQARQPFDTLFAMAAWTILLSVLLHGLSAVPLANWYARRLENAPPDAPELKEVVDPYLVRRHLRRAAHGAATET